MVKKSQKINFNFFKKLKKIFLSTLEVSHRLFI